MVSTSNRRRARQPRLATNIRHLRRIGTKLAAQHRTSRADVGIASPSLEREDAAMEIDAALSASKRHFSSDTAALRSRTEFPKWIGDAYDWALAAAAEQDPDPSVLDKIALAFHSAADAFASTLAFERRRSRSLIHATAPAIDVSQTNCFDLCVQVHRKRAFRRKIEHKHQRSAIGRATDILHFDAASRRSPHCVAHRSRPPSRTVRTA